MDEEQEIQAYEEQVQEDGEQEMSRAEQIGATLGSGIRSVLSGAGSVVSGLTRPLPSVVPSTMPTAYATPYTIVPIEQPPPATGAEDLSDLFEVPQPEDNDIYVDDLLEVDEEESVDDLLSVSQEDIMGPKPKPKIKFIRTNRPYPPASGLVGLR